MEGISIAADKGGVMEDNKLTIEEVKFEIEYLKDLLITTSCDATTLVKRLNYLESIKREMEKNDD